MTTAFAAPLGLPCSSHLAVSRAARFVHRKTPGHFRVQRSKRPLHHHEALVAPRAATMSATLISHLQLSAALTLLYQSVFYFISSRLKTDRLADLAGTSNIAILALLSLFLSGPLSARHVLVSIAIVTWALRLGTFLVLRIAVWKRDRRFDEVRGNPKGLATFWFLQAVWVWVTSLPATALSAYPATPAVWSDVAAAALFVLGLGLEAFADGQKETARARKGWPETGLWRLSRHPNYFGEMLVWWGVYLAVAPGLHGTGHIAVLSPVFVMLLLLFVSGVPILERSADKKFGEDSEYRLYRQCTSVLVPFPPRLYEKVPRAVKKFLFLDLEV